MEYSASRFGSDLYRGDAVAGNARRPSAGAESTGKRKPSCSAKNQPSGKRGARPTDVCDAEFCGTTVGQREPHVAGCGLQAGEREHGASGRGCRYFDCNSSGDERCATSAIAREYSRYPDAAGRAESSGWRGGELRSAVRQTALLSSIGSHRPALINFFEDRREESIAWVDTGQRAQVGATSERR
jgi:hypothetical protein